MYIRDAEPSLPPAPKPARPLRTAVVTLLAGGLGLAAAYGYLLFQLSPAGLVLCIGGERPLIPRPLCEARLRMLSAEVFADPSAFPPSGAVHFAVTAYQARPARDPRAAAQLRVLDLLKAHGVDVNQRAEPHGLTPLHVAVLINSPQVLGKLLEMGADPSLRSQDGETALDLARRVQASNGPLLRPEVIAVLEDAAH